MHAWKVPLKMHRTYSRENPGIFNDNTAQNHKKVICAKRKSCRWLQSRCHNALPWKAIAIVSNLRKQESPRAFHFRIFRETRARAARIFRTRCATRPWTRYHIKCPCRRAFPRTGIFLYV